MSVHLTKVILKGAEAAKFQWLLPLATYTYFINTESYTYTMLIMFLHMYVCTCGNYICTYTIHVHIVWLQHLVGSGNDYAHDRLTELQSSWLTESHSRARHVHPHICGPNSSIGRVNRAEVKQASYLVLVWQTGWQMLCSCWLKSLITIPFPIHTFMYSIFLRKSVAHGQHTSLESVSM